MFRIVGGGAIDMEIMRLALKLAKKTDPYPNPRVGAVLVKDDQLIGIGYHKAAGRPHAEIEAIEDAKRRGKDAHAARGATLYVTLEPCSHNVKRTAPCTDAIIRNGIKKVVYAMKDPNPLVSGAAVLRKAGIRVVGPTNQKSAEGLNKRYIANISKKPFVAIKMAMSADGKTATRTGDSRWISNARSRKMVHRMRSEFDAVMVGAGTIRKDNPLLTSHGNGRNPYRIIIDGRLGIAPKARILSKNDGKTIIVASERTPKSRIAKMKKNAMVLVCGKKSVDLRKLMHALAAMGMRKILIEGGSELNASAIEAGIVDRLYLFIAPKIIGGRDAKPVIGGFGIAKMSDALTLSGPKVKRIGTDLLLEFNR